MSKPKRALKKIPTFKTEDAEREFRATAWRPRIAWSRRPGGHQTSNPQHHLAAPERPIRHFHINVKILATIFTCG